MKLFSRSGIDIPVIHSGKTYAGSCTSIVEKIQKELRTYHAQPEKGKENKVAIVYLSLLPSDIYIQLHI